MLGSAASNDRTRWLNARAQSFDSLREQMLSGTLDIDSEDKVLLEEILMIHYKFSSKGAIQIESKDDMRSRGVKSPDSLDALVYATADLSKVIDNPYKDKKPGDLVTFDYNVLDSKYPFYNDWVW
jgi:hypothetical protein